MPSTLTKDVCQQFAQQAADAVLGAKYSAKSAAEKLEVARQLLTLAKSTDPKSAQVDNEFLNHYDDVEMSVDRMVKALRQITRLKLWAVLSNKMLETPPELTLVPTTKTRGARTKGKKKPPDSATVA